MTEEFNLSFEEALKLMRNGKKLEAGTGWVYKIDEDGHIVYGAPHIEPEMGWKFSKKNINDLFNLNFRLFEEPENKVRNFPNVNKKDGFHGRFDDLKVAENWEKASETFMELKAHPLVVMPSYEKQFVFSLRPTNDLQRMELYIDCHISKEFKIERVSPCFACYGHAMGAISDIGSANIMHMFKTFQGIIE